MRALKTIEPYQEGDIAKLLAAADMASGEPTVEVYAVTSDDVIGEPTVGVDEAMVDALLGEEPKSDRPFRVRPVIPEAIFVTNMVSNERQRITDQLRTANEDLSVILTDIEAANAELAAVNAKLRDLGKKRDNVVEDIADLERADAICEAALRKADEPTT